MNFDDFIDDYFMAHSYLDEAEAYQAIRETGAFSAQEAHDIIVFLNEIYTQVGDLNPDDEDYIDNYISIACRSARDAG